MKVNITESVLSYNVSNGNLEFRTQKTKDWRCFSKSTQYGKGFKDTGNLMDSFLRNVSNANSGVSVNMSC